MKKLLNIVSNIIVEKYNDLVTAITDARVEQLRRKNLYRETYIKAKAQYEAELRVKRDEEIKQKAVVDATSPNFFAKVFKQYTTYLKNKREQESQITDLRTTPLLSQSKPTQNNFTSPGLRMQTPPMMRQK